MGINRKSELKELLNKQHNWPEEFLFKFIYKSDADTEKKLRSLFKPGDEINIKTSKKENFNSMSVKAMMDNAEGVLGIYNKVSQIEGVFAL
jgi:putative lipoic acid-binding regulatory protein